MKRGDKVMVVIFAIMLISGACIWAVRAFMLKPAELSAEILQNGRVIRKFDLKQGLPPEEFKIESYEGYNIIQVNGDKIAIIEADCPDKDCVRRGWLKCAGDSAVCLPHRVVIRVIGAAAVDGVTY